MGLESTIDTVLLDFSFKWPPFVKGEKKNIIFDRIEADSLFSLKGNPNHCCHLDLENLHSLDTASAKLVSLAELQ